MLKLPKGLKKKKKGKKSKKDQELFTEEELEQYKREHQQHREEADSATTSDAEHKPSAAEEKSEEDDEWQKFKQLTAGVDSILHKTQDDLDRIKSTSFFKRVPPPSEKKKVEEEATAAREAEKLEEEKRKKAEEEANRDVLAEAVVELSDSEEESEEADDIFDTDYIDAITSGEVQLAVVPDSPVLEVDDGPDPFDTSYAEKLIKGPEVSKRGKKLVNIGAAVEVLTGRVDPLQATQSIKRRPRRGPQNLLLDDGDEAIVAGAEVAVESTTPDPPKTLLDGPADDIPDVPIDLSVSLHLTLQQQQQQQQEKKEEKQEEGEAKATDFVSEFDVLKDDDDDEFAELAAESLAKKDEVVVLKEPQPLEFKGEVQSDWAEFEAKFEEEPVEEPVKAKPARPPPPPSAAHTAGLNEEESDDEFKVPDDDPFDTTFVEKVLPGKSSFDDDDFDPRAEEEKVEAKKLEIIERDLLGGSNQDLTVVDLTVNLVPKLQKDLLAGSTTDLTALGPEPIAPVQNAGGEEEEEADFDPFDTSAVTSLVQPKQTELKFLEKELLTDTKLKHSLSDPDFDPRAEEAKQIKPDLPEPVREAIANADFDPAQRKSSLSLNIQPKSVAFLVPQPDLLGGDHDGGKIQKPLTPYYCKENTIEEVEPDDPFDTSFVPETKPTKVELNLLEQDLLASTKLSHSLSDPDFDPRADDGPPKVEQPTPKPDLLSTNDDINIKVLTPAQESKDLLEEELSYADPFDTSIALNIQPGKAELKLIESELLPAVTPEIQTGVLDTLTDAQELGLGDKVLTPQVPLASNASLEEVDPFDTSFADNLGPGKTEIKILETELIEH